jgi:hypothetical protein
MRNVSFMLTEPQVREGTKSVTRRLNWHWAKPGMHLMACRKLQGRKKGEPIVKIREIEILSVRRERLDAMIDNPEYGAHEARLEGFNMTGREFVDMFVSHMKVKPETEVTRVAFKYV